MLGWPIRMERLRPIHGQPVQGCWTVTNVEGKIFKVEGTKVAAEIFKELLWIEAQIADSYLSGMSFLCEEPID